MSDTQPSSDAAAKRKQRRADTAKRNAEAEAARLARLGACWAAGTPSADDPRWEMWNKWKAETTQWSRGDNKRSNATNGEATFEAIVAGFMDREVRLDLTDEELEEAMEKWRKRGSDKRYEPTRARKDGTFVSGGVLQDDSKAPNPCCPTNKKNFVNGNVRFVSRMLCYDVDGKDGTRHVARVRGTLRERNQGASIWSTHGHTDAVEKSRFVFYTNADIPTRTPEERRIYRLVYELIGDDFIGKTADGKHAWDTTCQNEARVIFLPSHNGVSPTFEYFEPGNQLDVAPYIVEAKRLIAEAIADSERKTAERKAEKAPNDRPRTASEYDTPWLPKALALFMPRLNLADLALKYCEGAKRLPDKSVVSMCVNTHASGVAKCDDMQARNAKDADTKIGVLYCFHDTCKALAKPTAKLLDMLIADHGISLARFLDFVDGITDAERAEMLLPDGFGVENSMICGYKREKRTIDGEDVTVNVPCPVSGVFLLKALSRDELSGAWGKEIEFEDADGMRKAIVVAASLVHGDGSDLFKELAAAGLWIASDPWSRGKFKELLNTWETDERITDVTKPGWMGEVYMSPLGQVVGEIKGTYRLRDGVGAADQQKGGSLQGWLDGVGHAVWSGDTPQFALGACTGVAGVLVQLAGLDTIGIHLLGELGSGKTISQTVGASCVANPKADRGVLITGRGTDNAMEGKFEKSNGSSMHMDEAKTGNAKILEALIFMANAGVGKMRMKQDTTARAAKTWATCWTFSSEKSLASIFEGVGGELVTGAAVRLISIGMTDCPDVGKARADAVKDAARANYGHALPVFVAEIMKRRLHERPDLVRRLIDGYAAKLEATTTAAHRARQAFGVLWLAGELMKAAELAPKAADIGSMIRWAWSSYVGGSEMLDPKAANMRAIETYLRTHIGTTVLPRGGVERPVGEVIAWYDATMVYLRSDVVEKLPKVTLGRREVAIAFDTAGVLDRPSASRKGLTWQKVPGHGAVDHYRLKMVLHTTVEDDTEPEEVRDPVADYAHSVSMMFRNAPAKAAEAARAAKKEQIH